MMKNMTNTTKAKKPFECQCGYEVYKGEYAQVSLDGKRFYCSVPCGWYETQLEDEVVFQKIETQEDYRHLAYSHF